MAWGLEARVPFLDKAFLEVAMDIDPKEKQFSKGASQETDEDGRPKMEKYILRKAFDVSRDGKVNLSISHLRTLNQGKLTGALPLFLFWL